MTSLNLTTALAAMMLFACLLPAAAAEVNLSKLAEADEFINRAIDEKKIPGAVLLVGKGSAIVYEKAYGHRAVEPSQRPMTTDTIFDMASLSKPMACATSVLILIDRGKIALDDPVAKYIPAFGNRGKEKITVEMLLLHRGGLIPDNPMADYVGTREEMIQRINDLTPKWEPGTHFAYTDVGFIVLGELVQAVDGRGLDQFAKEEIFQPLGMHETMFMPPDDLRDRIAPTEKRKKEDEQWIIGEVHDPRAFALGGIAGHAGLFSTARDTARWIQMLNNGGELDGTRILSEATVNKMLTMQTLPDGKGGRGLGVDMDSSYSSVRGARFERGKTFGHTGWTGTMFWSDPREGVYLVLLTNRVHPDGKGEVKELRINVATVVAKVLLGPAASEAAQ